MRSRSIAFLCVLATACGGDSVDRNAAADEARRAAADTVRMAQEAYDPAVFDTIHWAADSLALKRGAVVWSFSCSKCHGATGLGDGGFVAQGDTLRPPSFLRSDWRFDSDLDGLRRYIFAGNEKGMPHWGLVGLKPSDIDAVARYIDDFLRLPAKNGR